MIQEVKPQYKRKSHVRKDDDEEEDAKILETKRVEAVEFMQISVGYEFACGISYPAGDLYCWGEASRLKSLLHGVLPGPFKQVSVGKIGACAIRADDEKLQCYGTPLQTRMKLNPPPEWVKFDQIKVGPLAVCAVDLDSQLYCWGGGQMPSREIIVA